MDKGEERNFDLNGDGSFDLYLKVVDIEKSTNKVTFLIRQYVEQEEEVEALETIDLNETIGFNQTLSVNNTEGLNKTEIPEITGFAILDIFNFSEGNGKVKIALVSISILALATIAFVSFKRINH